MLKVKDVITHIGNGLYDLMVYHKGIFDCKVYGGESKINEIIEKYGDYRVTDLWGNSTHQIVMTITNDEEEKPIELREQLQKIISKYVDGFKVGQPNGTKENFKVILNNEYKETIVMEYAFPFGAGLAVGEIFACQGITKKLGELLQNLKSIEIELDNLNKGEKNDGTKTDYINTVVQQDSKRR